METKNAKEGGNPSMAGDMGLKYKSSVVPVNTEVAGVKTSYSNLSSILLLAMHFLLIYFRVSKIGNFVIGFTFFCKKKFSVEFRVKKRFHR